MHKVLKKRLEAEDTECDGHIAPEKLVKIFAGIKCPDTSTTDIEKYVRHLEKDQRGRINYQKLILKLENSEKNYPLKSLALRLAVFMQ